MSGKGGARHAPKPLVDTMVLMQVLQQHDDILRDLGAYNTTSKNQSVEPKEIMHCFALLQDSVKLSSTAEVHTQPLRQALLKCVQEDPSLNDTKWNCGVWANLKCERVGVLLFHPRRLKNLEDLSGCAAKLTSAEFVLLKRLLESVDSKPQPENLAKRKLKKEISEVSTDSKGYPAWLKSPQKPLAIEDKKPLPKEGGGHKGPPTFLRRKVGQRAACQKQEKEAACQKQEKEESSDLQELMGFKEVKPKKKKHKGLKKKGVKKDLAKKPKGKKKPAASNGPCPKGPSSSSRVPWQQVKITYANKPAPRTYITGSYEKRDKCQHIVEVSSKRSAQHKQIANKIMRDMREKHLTKEEALKLRGQLC